MSFDIHSLGSLVPESYSRQLDERVAMQEMPYGYVSEPPAADTNDYDSKKLSSRDQY